MQDSDSPDGRGWQGRNSSSGGDNDVTATVIGDVDGKACGPAKDAAGVLAEALRAMRNAESDLGKLVAVRDAATDLTRLGADKAISGLEDIARDVGNLTPIEIGAALTNSAKLVAEAAAYDSAELYEIRPKFEPSAEIIRLARLKLIDYERERSAAAKRLGMRASALDLCVKAQRSEAAGGDNRQGRALRIPDVDPWHDLVDGAELLDDITRLPGSAGKRGSHRRRVDGSHALLRRLHDLAAARDHLAGKGLRQDHLARRPLLHGRAAASGLQCRGGGNLPRRREDEADTPDGRGRLSLRPVLEEELAIFRQIG
jgi:hypothetical protein